MKRSPKPTVDYLDERRGDWTEIEFGADRIVVRRSHRMHWIPQTLSLLIVALLVLPLSQSPVGLMFLFLVALFILTTWNGQRIADRKRFPIVIANNTEVAKSELVHGRYFLRRQVRKVIVRENRNREGDDVHLVQVYMKVKDLDKLVLLYQQAWTVKSKEKVEILAQKIRIWIASP